MNYYPLIFEPVYKDYVWGGQRIGRHFHRIGVPAVCAESWEVAARPEGMSIVRNGVFSGRSLGDLMNDHGTALLGTSDHAPPFPLLIKILDARERLSVQVHPNDAAAARHGGEAKSEMWYILDAAPGACVYAGLQPGTTPAALQQALGDNCVEQLLHTVPVNPGDAIFMPGGRVHAIGEGCLILEVQQNSNTTYRLYDWGRVDQKGHPRELHIEQAMRVIDWDDIPHPKVSPEPLARSAEGSLDRILTCPYFEMHRMRIVTRMPVPRPAGAGVILFVAEGKALLTASGVSVHLDAGTTCLLPAVCVDAAISANQGPAVVLAITPRIAGARG